MMMGGYNGMMGGPGGFGGFGTGFGIIGGILQLAVIIGIIYLVYFLIKKSKSGQGLNFTKSNEALETLKERYAKGEITEEEYRRMKIVLED